MKNLTLSVDEKTLEAAREYAFRHNTTVNRMVREFLARTVQIGEGERWLDELFEEMDQATTAAAEGTRWKRTELYDGRIEWPPETESREA